MRAIWTAILIAIVLLVLLFAKLAWAEDYEIRQEYLPDVSGNPVFSVTDSQGSEVAEMRQQYLPDISGNPVFTLEEK